jgi:aminoglycoside phosphotransferase (APT) family kinase protein
MPDLSLIFESRRDAASRAVRSVFGKQPLSDLTTLSGGVSGAQILHFSVLGRPYVLRVEPERIAVDDRRRGFACMTAAAENGAAPRVHHADPADGVAIMDFIPGRPIATYPGGPAELAKALGALIAKVHAAPLFPSLGDYPGAIERLLNGLQGSPLFQPGELAPHAEGLAAIRSALPWDSTSLVASHNDPNPRNILFDGERLWLIDWELACANDPLVDVAILSSEFAQSTELEDVLLQAALGVAPDRRLRARLRVIHLLTRLFYGCIVMDSLGDTPCPITPTAAPALTPAAFQNAVAEGRLATGAPETAHAFARMSLAAFAAGMEAPGIADDLKRAAESAGRR